MRKSVRIALVGVVGGGILTVVPIVNPFAGEASTENTTTQPVGVEQPFPTKGTVPVVTPSPSKSSESASGKIKEAPRSEEHTSELQSLMRISYAVICLKKKRSRHNANKYPR